MRASRRRVLLLLLSACLFMACLPAYAAGAEMVALRTTYVRKSASGSARVVGTLYEGDVVQKLGTLSGFVLVSYQGGYGYVAGKDLAIYIDGGGSSSGDISVSQGDYSGDIQVSSGGEYTATANVNVRSGPGTGYRILGVLSRGDTVAGVGKSGNWTEIVYNGAKGYVSSSYLSYSITITADDGGAASARYPEGVFFTTALVDVYNKAGEDGKVIGTLYAGTRAVRSEVSGSFSLIETEDLEGYVRTGYLKEVKGTGAYEFTPRNRYMYATDYVSAYYIPVEVNNYRMGTYDKNEPVWVLGESLYWTKALVDGYVVYVNNDKLQRKPSSGLELGRTGKYAPGETLTLINDSETYADARKEPYIHPFADKAYGKLKKGTDVVVMYCAGDFAAVMWEETDKKKISTDSHFPANLHTAYISMEALG